MKVVLSLICGAMLGAGAMLMLVAGGFMKAIKEDEISLSMDLSAEDVERLARAAETMDGQTMVLSEGKTVRCSAESPCKLESTIR